MSTTGTFRCAGCGALNRADAARTGARCGRCKAGLVTDGAPQHVTDDELDRLLASSPVPVLVDFYADWCGPCRSLAPTLARLGREKAGRMLIVKVDTERDQRHAQRLAVRGIPAVFLFSGGRQVAEETGAQPIGQWRAMVAKAGV